MQSDKEKIGQAEMERWLDRALHARVEAEPRAGLEERVLARLASEPPRVRFHWWPVISAAAAILIFAMALVIWTTIKPRPTVAAGQQPANHSTGTVNVERRPAVMAANKPDLQKHHRQRSAKHALCCAAESVMAVSQANVEPERLPMLATFPAPSPQTSDERLLSRLAARRDSFDLASMSTDSGPPKELWVPKLEIEPMEGTPPDNPRE